MTPKRPYGLVMVAEGAQLVETSPHQPEKSTADSLRASLSPLATGEAIGHVIQREARAVGTVATRLQLLIEEETFPLVLGLWTRGGKPTAVDRQLGLACGAGAFQAVRSGKYGVMLAFAPPESGVGL